MNKNPDQDSIFGSKKLQFLKNPNESLIKKLSYWITPRYNFERKFRKTVKTKKSIKSEEIMEQAMKEALEKGYIRKSDLKKNPDLARYAL